MKTTALLLSAALLALPTATFAATYHYVDATGTVRTLEAANATDALMHATNIAPHSGVTLDQGILESGDTTTVSSGGSASSSQGATSYRYVDESGTVRAVVAPSPAAALMSASDRDPNSGVIIYQGEVHVGQEVPGV